MNPRRSGAPRRAGGHGLRAGLAIPASSAGRAGLTTLARGRALTRRAMRAGSTACGGPAGRAAPALSRRAGRADSIARTRCSAPSDLAPAPPGEPDPKEVSMWSSGT
jgi:hypothetical protein